MPFIINGQESKGPYGYLCLGLSYITDSGKGSSHLDSLLLVKLDMTLRACIEAPLYEESFRHSADEIAEKDGIHYYNGCPVVNFGMLKIPKQTDGINIKEAALRERYTERYVCALDFDEEALRGRLAGFDVLGKFLSRDFDLTGLSGFDDIRRELLEDVVTFGRKTDEGSESGRKKCEILNFDFSVNDKGEVKYEYNSLW